MEKREYEDIRKCQWDILIRYDKYIADTNTKTSILLSLQVLLVGIFVANYINLENYMMLKLGIQKSLSVLLPTYVLITCFYIIWKAIKVVMPNLDTESKPSNYFFGSVSITDPIQRKVIFENPSQELIEDLFSQVKFVAGALSSKMKSLRRIYLFVIYLQLLPIGAFTIFFAILEWNK